jgi:hypothetical protein
MAYVLEEQPLICAAAAEGQISMDKLEELATFVEPTDDEFWADAAPKRTYREIRDWARIKRRRARDEAAKAIDERSLKVVYNHADSYLAISGRIPGADGAVVKETLDRLAEQFGPDPDDGWTPMEKRRADALVQLATTHMAADPDTNRATVVIHCAPEDLEREDGTAKLEFGTIVTSPVVQRLACDGFLEVVLHGPDGQAVGIGRRSRIVPPAMMRELKRRDDGCVICGNTAGSQAHHVKPWWRFGKTDFTNLVILCWKCHRLVHDKMFDVSREPSGMVLLINPDGIPVPRRPEPLPPKYRERILGPPALVG